MNATATPLHPLRANPVFWLALMLLGACVAASFTTLAIALKSADRALPADYHWEGAQLDADFARVREAVRLGLRLRLDIAASGECVARLEGASTASALLVSFANGSSPDLDRLARLTRGSEGEFRGDCGEARAGRWRVTVEDAGHTWRLRARADGPVRGMDLVARAPEGAT
jgi:hypothetical protein